MSDVPPAPKRLVPQLLETSTGTRRAYGSLKSTVSGQEINRTPSGPALLSRKMRPGRNFTPEPIEASSRSSKDRPAPSWPLRAEPPLTIQEEPEKGSMSGARRRFSPALVETSRRSRRSGNSTSTLLWTAAAEGRFDNRREARSRPKAQSHALGRTAEGGTNLAPAFDPFEGQGLRRTTSPRLQATARQHSFQVPSLERIESSESDGSACPSLSTSPSVPSEGGPELNGHAGKRKQSRDEAFSGYFLDLAARAAEKQLQEQAMAAFPNSDFHETVNHFAGDRESDGSDEEADMCFSPRSQEAEKERMRRESAADLIWEVREMRRHHKRLAAQRRPPAATVKEARGHHGAKLENPSHPARSVSPQNAMGLDRAGQPHAIVGGWQKGVGLESMRSAASPPMLGQDLKFRMFHTPRPTVLEVDQSPSSSLRSLGRHQNGGGLWGGFCVGNSAEPAEQEHRPGTIAPESEQLHPLNRGAIEHEPVQVEPVALTLVEDDQVRHSDKQSWTEEDIDREVTDEFVAQVYNYLSLGYPSLGRKFDYELSNVTRVPLKQLSRDDREADAKGFVGLEEGNGITMRSAADGSCERWKALRQYIREWMKQHRDLTIGPLAPDAWGVRGRRGSWAV